VSWPAVEFKLNVKLRGIVFPPLAFRAGTVVRLTLAGAVPPSGRCHSPCHHHHHHLGPWNAARFCSKAHCLVRAQDAVRCSSGFLVFPTPCNPLTQSPPSASPKPERRVWMLLWSRECRLFLDTSRARPLSLCGLRMYWLDKGLT
jgi:hypothetical protein